MIGVLRFAPAAALVLLGSISLGANATTVRHLYEWSYRAEGGYHVLQYIQEIWDTDNYGFNISCEAKDTTFITIDYFMFNDKYFSAFKRKGVKPKMEIRSSEGHITVIGDFDEEVYPKFVFKVLQFTHNDVSKILSSSDAIITFPNQSFKIWQIKKSSEISKFISACPRRRGHPNSMPSSGQY